MASLRVTWRKSAIGYHRHQQQTLRALGLRRLGQTVEHKDTASVRGMIHKVRHLVVAEAVGAEDADPSP